VASTARKLTSIAEELTLMVEKFRVEWEEGSKLQELPGR